MFAIHGHGFGEKKDVISEKQMRETYPTFEGNSVDKSISNSLFQPDRQSFQTNDKKIGGQWITLPNTPSRHNFR